VKTEGEEQVCPYKLTDGVFVWKQLASHKRQRGELSKLSQGLILGFAKIRWEIWRWGGVDV